MSGKPEFGSTERGATAADDCPRIVKFIAVGNCEEWHRKGHALISPDILCLSFEEVSDESLGFYQPSIIYSPVLAQDFDCIDLALRLHGLGFSGEYQAVARNLPNPRLIENEVRQLCPQLDFRVAPSV